MSLLHWESSMDFHHADSESLVSTYSRDFLDIMWSIFSWLTSGLISTPFPPDADHRESLLFLLIHVKNSSVLDLHGGAPHFIKSQVSSPPLRDPPQSHPPLTAFLLNSVSSSKHLWLIESIHLFGDVCYQALLLTEPQGVTVLPILFTQHLKPHGRRFMNISSVISEWNNKRTNTEVVLRITQSW